MATPSTQEFDPFGAAYRDALDSVPAQTMRDSANAPSALAATVVRRTETVRSSISGSGTLSGSDVARLAHNAGFRGTDLVSVVAIARRESNWTPGAFNPNPATNDLSYGLMQINMQGSLGVVNRARFGISSNDQLLDPQTNMNAAFTLYSASGGTLRPWGGYKGMSDTFHTDLGGAQQAVDAAGLGGL